MMTRRQLLAMLGVVGPAALGAYAFLIEPQRLVVTRHTLQTRPSSGTSDSSAVLRFVQLTDLHLQHVDRHAQRIAAAVNRLAPHIIFFTGDSIERNGRLGELGKFLDLLDAQTPKYAVLGNWENKTNVNRAQLAEVYAARNCRLLINQTVLYQHEGHNLLITGLDDLVSGRPSIADALHEVEPRSNHLILVHCPAHRDVLLQGGAGRSRWKTSSQPGAFDLARYAPQYMLAGHTHGGQVRLFSMAPVRPPGSGRYVSGWYRDVWPHLYVSQGLGTAVMPVRLAAPPEVAYFEWSLAA